MNYDYLINSSINEINMGINIINNELVKEENCYSLEYLILYCEKLLECTFNRFRNDDYEYLKPCIVYYNNYFKFIPVELETSIKSLITIYDLLKQNNIDSKVRLKK